MDDKIKEILDRTKKEFIEDLHVLFKNIGGQGPADGQFTSTARKYLNLLALRDVFENDLLVLQYNTPFGSKAKEVIARMIKTLRELQKATDGKLREEQP